MLFSAFKFGLFLTFVATVQYVSHCKDPSRADNQLLKRKSYRRDWTSVGSHVQLGPRPYYLVNDMDSGSLKTEMQECSQNLHTFLPSDKIMGHRGACMQFPEHSKESYMAAITMGAGIVECDVTFTKDLQLVCRHSQCDLHTTTDILLHPELASLCTKPFSPAEYSFHGKLVTPASAECCTSDITLEQFKSLRAKMDGADTSATNVDDYVAGGIPDWRTQLYASRGTLMTHNESIELFSSMNVKMTPELKAPLVPMPFNGFTVEKFAQKIVDEYTDRNITPSHVFLQSFVEEAIDHWLKYDAEFGKQAAFLWEPKTQSDTRDPSMWPDFVRLHAEGVNIISIPIFVAIDLKNDELVISAFASNATAAGMELVCFSLERSGPLYVGGGGYYYQTVNGLNPAPGESGVSVINNDGDMLTVVDFLFRQVGLKAMFTDWAATLSFYINCIDLV